MMIEHCRKSRHIVLAGLDEATPSNTKVGDEVIIQMGQHWDDLAGYTYTGKVTKVSDHVIRIVFTSNATPGDSGSIGVMWGSCDRSRFYHMTAKPAPQVEPDDVTQPAKTLFGLMCDYDAALATLQALKPGYDDARERFINARAALGAVLGTHKDL